MSTMSNGVTRVRGSGLDALRARAAMALNGAVPVDDPAPLVNSGANQRGEAPRIQRSGAPPGAGAVADGAEAVSTVGGAVFDVVSGAAAGQSAVRRVASRLASKFGLGKEPAARRALFAKLEALTEGPRGDIALRCISEAVAQAAGARSPDRYFCRAVVLKLRESGLLAPKGGDTSW
jgi:hypothetical protein